MIGRSFRLRRLDPSRPLVLQLRLPVQLAVRIVGLRLVFAHSLWLLEFLLVAAPFVPSVPSSLFVPSAPSVWFVPFVPFVLSLLVVVFVVSEARFRDVEASSVATCSALIFFGVLAVVFGIALFGPPEV